MVSIDDFKANLVKYPDEKVHSVIVDIYNATAETRDLPREINTGLLLALQKRPIMLLCILCKILTITFPKRTWYRVADKIIKEEAAYQPFADPLVHKYLMLKVKLENPFF